MVSYVAQAAHGKLRPARAELRELRSLSKAVRSLPSLRLFLSLLSAPEHVRTSQMHFARMLERLYWNWDMSCFESKQPYLCLRVLKLAVPPERFPIAVMFPNILYLDFKAFFSVSHRQLLIQPQLNCSHAPARIQAYCGTFKRTAINSYNTIVKNERPRRQPPQHLFYWG